MKAVHLCLAGLIALLLGAGGCNIVGAAARVLPPQTIHPRYAGLSGQTVAVMAWADRGLRVDWSSLQADLAASMQNKLKQTKSKELEKTTYPITTASIVRYQRDHPEVEVSNIADIAPKLGVTRLIFIEVEDFGTRAPSAVELFRGSMSVTLKIVEVNGATGKIAFEEPNIHVVFPEHVPDDGTPTGNDYKFYLGTIDAMTTELLQHLISHPEEGT